MAFNCPAASPDYPAKDAHSQESQQKDPANFFALTPPCAGQSLLVSPKRRADKRLSCTSQPPVKGKKKKEPLQAGSLFSTRVGGTKASFEVMPSLVVNSRFVS